ncbi:MAG: HxsD-like protein [Oscillospiraceae bacterium]|nr:HxsD-like protein [Oscillospiraceae bacterium]
MIKKTFDLDIYPQRTIRKAAEDYKHICSITVLPIGSTATCVFRSSKLDENTVCREFCNYLIDLIGSGEYNNADS